MKFITLSGLDGSGKSTQAQMLQEYWHAQEKKVFYFHAIAFSISKTYNILRPHKVLTGHHKESVAKANCLQIFLRKIALKIDIWRFKDLLRKLALSEFDYILSDRYFFDSVLNINYLSGQNATLPLEESIPRPDLAIYLQIDPKIIMSRERKPDQGIKYLETKAKLFESKIDQWNMKVIDGARDPQTVFFEILNRINKI